MQKSQLKFFCIVLGILLSFHANSEILVKNQVHARMGLIAGSYDGQFTGNFAVPYSFDFAHESFTSNTESWLVRFSQALDLPDSRPFYTAIGVSFAFYYQGKGFSLTQSEPNISIISSPKVRYYYTFDVGVSQVIVQSFGSIVQAVSSMGELGGSWGVIKQINKDIGIQAQVGAALGYGFSSVAVIGLTGKALFGLTYFY